jgi:acyl-coenzyme A synthetase/AMP-(fatty) acid ligase
MEHAVLSGSRKYPLKEPFVELLKGSLKTFLNAMTFPDKTCYPVASTNLQDFYNLVDVYLDAVFYPKNKAAFIWEGEPGEQRTLTYLQLHREVCKFANVLKKLGVETGDRVALYMPLVPELAIAMLACARIGATHTVIFGGFSADAIRDRVNDGQCKVIVTADGGY